MEDRKEEKEYMDKMKNILCSTPGCKTLSGPAQLLDHLYIANLEQAMNRTLLKRLKITHVLNCAGTASGSKDHCDGRLNPYHDTKIKYLAFEALDNEGYPILMHFSRAKGFIDEAKYAGGRVLVHCEMGINRSGAICVAYMMLEERLTLLQAIRQIKYDRPVVLCNEGFRKQLIGFARERGLLHKNK